MSWSTMYIEQGSVLRTLSHHLYSIYPWDRLSDHVVELLVKAPPTTQLWLKNKLRLKNYLPTSERAGHLSATQRIRAIFPCTDNSSPISGEKTVGPSLPARVDLGIGVAYRYRVCQGKQHLHIYIYIVSPVSNPQLPLLLLLLLLALILLLLSLLQLVLVLLLLQRQRRRASAPRKKKAFVFLKSPTHSMRLLRVAHVLQVPRQNPTSVIMVRFERIPCLSAWARRPCLKIRSRSPKE